MHRYSFVGPSVPPAQDVVRDFHLLHPQPWPGVGWLHLQLHQLLEEEAPVSTLVV